MTVDNLIAKIDIRSQYKAYGLGNLSLTDSELKTQLTNLANTAIAELVQDTNVSGAEFNVKVVSGTLVVSLEVDNNSVSDIEDLKVAVNEYLENEVAYLWWLENEPRYADGSARKLLKDVVKRHILRFVIETVPPKREMVAKEIPLTRTEYDYE